LRFPAKGSGRLVEVDSMKQSQRIVKNAVFGIGASLVGGLVYLATVLTIARMVSVVEFGKYSFVLAFAMFFQLLADAGLPRMLIREIAKEPQALVPLVGAAASLIWVVSVAVFLLVALIVPFLHFGTDVKIAALVIPLGLCAANGWRRHASPTRLPARHSYPHLDDKPDDCRLIQRSLSNQHGSAGDSADSLAPALSALLTHRALVAGTLQGSLPLEREVFCAYQYSPCR